MDGAVLVSSCLSTIRSANVHLTPNPTPTTETGMRHRTAECVAGAVVIAISTRNDTITLFLAGEKYVLLDKVRLLAESSHAIDMAEFYGRGYSDATRDLLASPAAEAFGHDFDLVSQ
jgi:diadenylate cyclase